MSNWPQIPTYSHSENECYHPVFEYAMNQVLSTLGITDLEMVPQFPTASGPVDFALRRISTGKIVMPIEIKRTQSGVRGLGRRQARDYQHNISLYAETSFYCVSNLEITELFCADPNRATTISQQIKLSSIQNAQLGKNKDEEIKNNLLAVLEEILGIVVNNKPFSYCTNMAEFEYVLRCTSDGRMHWHSLLMPYCFEYIRGAIHLHERTSLWKPATSYKSNPQRMLDIGSTIDFKQIFKLPLPQAQHFDHRVMADAYLAGKAFGDGDDFSALVGDILFRPQEGIVETDYDLARVLGIVAANEAGTLSETDAILDPCAGSGRLLAALVTEGYPAIPPTNIIAVEKEKKFAEALTLRLGLLFGRSVSPENSPDIQIKPLENISKTIFKNVKIAVVNPPFISGINSRDGRILLSERIKKLSGNTSELNSGQIGYEAVFLELLYNLLPEGATVAFIFPWQVVSRLSNEYSSLRRFFVEKLCLRHIIAFPMDGVFENVVMKTAIFVGTKGKTVADVKFTDIQIPITDLDIANFKQLLIRKSECYGVKQASIPTSTLLSSINQGWKFFTEVGYHTDNFIAKHMANFPKLLELNPNCRRGTMGNKGNTALTVNLPGWSSPLVPDSWYCGAVNNAKGLPKIITSTNQPNRTFVPPAKAYDVSSPQYSTLTDIVNDYIQKANGVFSTKKQKTSTKTASVIIRDLASDQRGIVSNAILLPRASREEAKLAIIQNTETLVSTNFFILSQDDNDEMILLASWIQSVFGQLQLEYFSISEAGMRKLEKNIIENLKIPLLSSIPSSITKEIIQEFSTESFLDLSNVKPRKSDELWANIINSSNPKEILSDATRFLQLLYDERQQ